MIERFIKAVRKIFTSPLTIMSILNTLVIIGILVIGREKCAGANCVPLPTQVCIQVADKGCTEQFGTIQCASVGSWTPWAGDTNYYDPDCVQVLLK